MPFYAYIPRPDGTKPVGTDDQWLIRDLKTLNGALKRVRSNERWSRHPFVVQTYTDLYNDKTFKTVYTHKPL